MIKRIFKEAGFFVGEVAGHDRRPVAPAQRLAHHFEQADASRRLQRTEPNVADLILFLGEELPPKKELRASLMSTSLSH